MNAPFGESAVAMIRKSSFSSSESGSSSGDGDKPEPSSQSNRKMDFLEGIGNSDELSTWELVLSSGAQDDANLIQKPLDIVLLGHTDGLV